MVVYISLFRTGPISSEEKINYCYTVLIRSVPSHLPFHLVCYFPSLQGYLSEAGASLVDMKLKLNVVPKTKVGRYSIYFTVSYILSNH